MKEKIKKLTGKNPVDFGTVAFEVVNKPDIELFEELVKQDDFLFDFIKNNVSQRLKKNVNNKNFKNLLSFMKFYSPSYEEFIVSSLAKYANEDLTDEILNIFENGTEDEKTYCAKYFSYIQDSLALELLRQFAFSENSALANNCAMTLGNFNDKESYQTALSKLHSNDDFEQFEGVNFLISYGDKSALQDLIATMKKSSMSENIASQIPYLEDLYELISKNYALGMPVLNNIINGLGEITPLSATIDFNLWEVFDFLIKQPANSVNTTVLANAAAKFETLTENDEYLFDEDKNTKNEVIEIKKLLNNTRINLSLVDEELNENSDYVYTALEISRNTERIRSLLNSKNQTLILKAAETLKNLTTFNERDRQTALNNLKDENLKAVILAL